MRFYLCLRRHVRSASASLYAFSVHFVIFNIISSGSFLSFLTCLMTLMTARLTRSTLTACLWLHFSATLTFTSYVR